MKYVALLVTSLFVWLGTCNAEEFDRKEQLIQHVCNSIEYARQEVSKLTQPLLEIHGMSSRKVRHLLNNLCTLKDGTYLEIGCFKGSTLLSAIYQNQGTLKDVVAIDNWLEFGGPKAAFMHNVTQYATQPIRFYEADCFSVNLKTFYHPINLYFYDGRHREVDQKAAFTYFDPIFDDIFIAVVDDWNWQQVRDGTWAAMQELGYNILYQQELFTPDLKQNSESWWNGVFIAVIEKQKR